jgi:hypothetical protein
MRKFFGNLELPGGHLPRFMSKAGRARLEASLPARLVERYRTAVNTYNEAVNALGVLPGPAFNEIWTRTERARTKCALRLAAVPPSQMGERGPARDHPGALAPSKRT